MSVFSIAFTAPACASVTNRQPVTQGSVPQSTDVVLVLDHAPRHISSTIGSPRHNPCFLTHLLAMAEQAPQTRKLRRTTTEAAQTSYRSAAAQTSCKPLSSGAQVLRLV